MNQIYSNFVMEDVFNSILSTKLDLSQFMTVDTSLEQDAGMIKYIAKRSVTGSVEDVAMGSGNTGDIEVTLSTTPYTVGVTQGRFSYYDEEAMKDNKVVEAGLTGLAEKMVNDFTAKAVAEWKKATLTQGYTGSIAFGDVCDAIAKLNLEDESSLFMLINVGQVAAFRKALKDELKYSEDFVRTGYIGSVAGVPVYVSKAIPDGEAIIATKEAVRVFIKKGTEMEQERIANTRQNKVYARKVAVVALVDATKVVRIATSSTLATEAAAAQAAAGNSGSNG